MQKKCYKAVFHRFLLKNEGFFAAINIYLINLANPTSLARYIFGFGLWNILIFTGQPKHLYFLIRLGKYKMLQILGIQKLWNASLCMAYPSSGLIDNFFLLGSSNFSFRRWHFEQFSFDNFFFTKLMILANHFWKCFEWYLKNYLSYKNSMHLIWKLKTLAF